MCRCVGKKLASQKGFGFARRLTVVAALLLAGTSFAFAQRQLIAQGSSANSNSLLGIQPNVPGALKAELRRVHFDGEHAVTLSYEGISLSVEVDPSSSGEDKLPEVIGRINGSTAFIIYMKGVPGTDTPEATVRIIWLDRSASKPQVFFTYYWHGAHCCTVTKIATADKNGIWHVVDAGTQDGEGYDLMDLDGDGLVELVSPDNSFWYAFACYACSYPPTQIKKLAGIELRDVTKDKRYREFLVERLRELEKAENDVGEDNNGYLAGWVAQRALLGELKGAWEIMLQKYNRSSDWTVECSSGEPIDKCPESSIRHLSFPEALKKHLLEHGYVSLEDIRNLPLVCATIRPSESNESHYAGGTACRCSAARSTSIATCWPTRTNACTRRSPPTTTI